MKASVFRLDEAGQYTIVPSKVSFARYLEIVEKDAAAAEGITRRLLQFILKTFEKHPEFAHPFETAEDLVKYPELLQLIQSTVYPLIGGTGQEFLGLGTPFSAEVFYLSDALHSLFTLKESGAVKFSIADLYTEENKEGEEKRFYQLVLERFYGVPASGTTELVYNIMSSSTGLPLYVRQDTDLRFADVKTTRKLPHLPETILTLARKNQLETALIREMLPLSYFRIEGFAIHRFYDVTKKYALDTIKNILLYVNDYTESEVNESLQEALRLIIQHAPLRIGLMPLLQVNQRYVYHEQVIRSSLLAEDKTAAVTQRFQEMAAWATFQRDPIVFQSLATTSDPDYQELIEGLREQGFMSYLFLPLWYSDKPVGILELASPVEGFFVQETALDLDPALDLIAQILRHSIENFEDAMDAVIKSNFTSLQPTIEWRFNEAAWRHLIHTVKGDNQPIEEIYFEEVFPLFGAIDIRNSSLQRNLALQQDYLSHLRLLEKKLLTLKTQYRVSYLEEKISECRYWIINVEEELTADEEVEVRNFFDRTISPFLRQEMIDHPETRPWIEDYFRVANHNASDVYRFSQDFDASQSQINQVLIRYFDAEKRKLEKKYPVYFERTRTDGLEYNLFAGASISPMLIWNAGMVEELRLWQLTSMIEVANLTDKLLPELKVPLQTTQLIIAFGQTINIHFRRDEKKFDVEGAYSVGYEIMKKRIDKVRVRNTGERLTQPGTIAIVYTSDREIEAWKEGIQFLQENQKLEQAMESLQLTEVEGITGLKALRLRIRFDQTGPTPG